MSENVKVRGGRDNAVLLLDAAEKMDLDPSVVRTTSYGFEVPKDVATKAGVEIDDSDEQFEKEVEKARKAADSGEADLSRSGFEEQEAPESVRQVEGEKPPAKKAAAKKAPAKKAPAKKAPAKKAAAKKTAAKKGS